MIIRRIEPVDFPEWLRMRQALWPDHPAEEHQAEMGVIVLDPMLPVFVSERPDGRLGGFLEAAVHINTYGCDTSPVGYIEGWYVDPDLRRHGIGARLVEAAEAWALAHGYQEMASDCELDNQISLQAHRALGYEDLEYLIHFRKKLS
jgi:aminoglycoside 6'-N-acetyltransferase I